MLMRRRTNRLRAYLGTRNSGWTIQTISEEECLSTAYYLYGICSYIIDFDEFRNIDYLIDVIQKLVKRLSLQQHFGNVLKKLISTLEKNGSLTLITLSEDSEIPIPTFRGTNTAYKYNEDADIDVSFPRDLIIHRPEIIDVYRYVYASNSPDKLLILLSKTFLSGRSFDTLPAKIQKIVNDVSSIQFIIDAVGLSINEARVLLLIFRTTVLAELSNLMREVFSDNRDSFCGRILKIEQSEINTIFRSDQKLRSFGFLDSEYELTPEAIDCIKTGSIDTFFSEILKEEDTKSAFDISSYAVEKESVEIARKLLSADAPLNILLYGAPGAGKTEFAKSIARDCALRVFTFQNDTELNKRENILCRLNCLLSINKADSVIVIDEADTILETTAASFASFFGGNNRSSAKKGTVNKIFENCNNRVIWIVNHTNQIEESTKRRFTYSIFFNEMPEQTLRSIAFTRLKKVGDRLNPATVQKILDLCSQFHVTGSSVENIERVIACSPVSKNKKSDEESLLRDIRNVLEANSTLLFGKAKMRQFVSSSYDEAVLNTSFPAEEIISMVRNALLFSEHEKSAQNGIRLLFYGESGTGKTEFARYIAQKLGRKILLKRASDILGMFVGENERHIKEAFSEAEQSGQILLFDEADSFFYSRESASRSWERTLVNEFLTQMEEFSGILICTTNLKSIMDAAMNRRFHISVEFKAMNEQGIKTLLDRYFPKIDFSKEDVRLLSRRSTVTPGDFGALSSRIRFMNKDEIKHDFIISELLKIQDEKNGGKSIGFGV